MDFSVGIIVTVSICVLVVTVLGYGLFLNRRQAKLNREGRLTPGGIGAPGVEKGSKYSSKSAVKREDLAEILLGAEESSNRKSSRSSTGKQKSRSPSSRRKSPNGGSSVSKQTQTDVSPSGEESLFSSMGVDTNGFVKGEAILKHEIKPRHSPPSAPMSVKSSSGMVSPSVATTIKDTSPPINSLNPCARVNPKGTASPRVEKIMTQAKKKRNEPTVMIRSAESEQPAQISKPNLRAQPLKPEIRLSEPATHSQLKPLDRKPPSRKDSQPSAMQKKHSNWRKNLGSTENQPSPQVGVEDFLILTVAGKHDTAFPLREVARFLVDRGLILEENGLFCLRDKVTKEVAFKVADVFSPGFFDRTKMEHYCTSGLTFVMCLEQVVNPHNTFEQMFAMTNECAKCFDGVVQDDNFTTLSNQTISHFRSRVADVRRKKMSR